jgi:hypothetical protein
MPQARRRTRATEDKQNTEAKEATETTEAEATEGEGEAEAKPRAPRAAKVYAVKDAELANALVGDEFDSEISEGEPASGEMIDAMRKNKAKWDTPEDGGIKHVFGSNSAIPLRNMYNKWLHEEDEESSIDIEDVDALYEAFVTEGQGWVTLSARTGATVGDVKAALKDKVLEEHDVDVTEGGRAYGKGENWRWVTADELNEAKAANGNGDDEAEDEESDEDTEAEGSDDSDDADGEDEEADAPKTPRRRRRQAA